MRGTGWMSCALTMPRREPIGLMSPIMLKALAAPPSTPPRPDARPPAPAPAGVGVPGAGAPGVPGVGAPGVPGVVAPGIAGEVEPGGSCDDSGPAGAAGAGTSEGGPPATAGGP